MASVTENYFDWKVSQNPMTIDFSTKQKFEPHDHPYVYASVFAPAQNASISSNPNNLESTTQNSLNSQNFASPSAPPLSGSSAPFNTNDLCTSLEKDLNNSQFNKQILNLSNNQNSTQPIYPSLDNAPPEDALSAIIDNESTCWYSMYKSEAHNDDFPFNQVNPLNSNNPNNNNHFQHQHVPAKFQLSPNISFQQNYDRSLFQNKNVNNTNTISNSLNDENDKDRMVEVKSSCSDEGWVVIDNDDFVNALSDFIAASIRKRPEAMNLTPSQLNSMLNDALAPLRSPSALQSLWRMGTTAYHYYGYGKTLYTIYKEPFYAKLVLQGLWTTASWVVVLLF